jgi:hypothetical protein
MNGLAPFVRGVQRERWRFSAAGLTLLALACVAMLGLDGLLRVGLAGGLGLVATGWLALALRPVARAPVIRTLSRAPEHIVWYYLTHRHRRGVHVSTTITLGLADGRRISTEVALDDEKEAVAFLGRHVPSARYGFSDELEETFNDDPPSIRRFARWR